MSLLLDIVNGGHIPYMGRPNERFGIIVSIKELFGVIQLLSGEEQILFSTSNGNRDVAIGTLILSILS